MKITKYFMLVFLLCLVTIASIDKAAFADNSSNVADNTLMVSMPNISAGYAHTVAIQEGGNVIAVGANHSGQCNVEGWESVVAVKAGFDITFGITNEGYVLAAGRNTFGQFTPEWEYLQDISVNLLHVVGLRPDGTVLALGNNDEGACNTSSWRNITDIAAGGWHTVGLCEDGTVVATGRNNEGQCNVQDWKNVVAIAAGGFHTIGLTSDGRVLATGDNQNGQCEVQNWYDMVAVDCALSHTVGLRKDGTVVAVGTNNDGQCDVNSWSNIVAISTNDVHTVGLTKSGTVVSTGQNSNGQRNVDDWREIRIGSPYPRTVKARTPNVPIQNISCSFDAFNGTMTISGNGAIPDCSAFSTFRTPWSLLAIQLETVVIRNGITRIGEFDFMGLATLDPEIGVKTFYIPKSVTEIGKANFMILYSLRDIYYEGTEDEWNRLIGSGEALPGGIRVHCQSGGSNPIENAITYPQAGDLEPNPFRNVFVGDTVLFGKYEQDNNPSNGPEGISWIFLDKSPDSMLIVSEYALDCQPYNKRYAELTWETCSLRRWLNDTFLNTAFTSYEQSLISTDKVSADKNPEESNSDPGNITLDQVFLLSIKEIGHYFDSDYARFCKPTAYAIEQGCKVYPDINTCWWWTRTPGCDNYYVTNVRGDGTFDYTGGEADRDYLCIRPAMWINLSVSAETGADTMPAWKQAYYDLILETPRIEEWNPDISDKDDKLLLCAYSLYDIDKDSIPELFLHFGNGEADEYGRLYTFRDGNIVLLTLSRTRQIAGSENGRWEEAFFPYGFNYFSTYPEGNGVWFAHERNGQYFTLWSIDGEYVMESDIQLRQEYAEVNSASVVFPGSCGLTEFPAYTLMPLMTYENWVQQVAPNSNGRDSDANRDLKYPENDPQFFEKVISGEIPVTPCLVPRLYGRWEREYFSHNLAQLEVPMYPTIESCLIMSHDYMNSSSLSSLPAPTERTVLYTDLDSDGQLEAVCCAQYITGGDWTHDSTFILSEQDGNVYAYGMTEKYVKNVDANGVVYFCEPAKGIQNLIYEGAFMLFFDKEESFFVNIPLENYAGIKCQPDMFEKIDSEQVIRYWQDLY